MSLIQFPKSSPYANVKQTSWYSGPISLNPLGTDRTDVLDELKSAYEYRPDKLSYDLYGTPVFYWIFMVRNMSVIRDPIWDFKAGIQFFYPTLDRIKSTYGS